MELIGAAAALAAAAGVSLIPPSGISQGAARVCGHENPANITERRLSDLEGLAKLLSVLGIGAEPGGHVGQRPGDAIDCRVGGGIGP